VEVLRSNFKTKERQLLALFPFSIPELSRSLLFVMPQWRTGRQTTRTRRKKRGKRKRGREKRNNIFGRGLFLSPLQVFDFLVPHFFISLPLFLPLLSPTCLFLIDASPSPFLPSSTGKTTKSNLSHPPLSSDAIRRDARSEQALRCCSLCCCFDCFVDAIVGACPSSCPARLRPAARLGDALRARRRVCGARLFPRGRPARARVRGARGAPRREERDDQFDVGDDDDDASALLLVARRQSGLRALHRARH